jgi:hypothetical protein
MHVHEVTHMYIYIYTHIYISVYLYIYIINQNRIDPISLNTIGVDNMNIDLKRGLPVFIEKLQSQFPKIHSQVSYSRIYYFYIYGSSILYI